MPRYFFHVQDGGRADDAIVLDVDSVTDVREEAVRFAGVLIASRDDRAFAEQDWSMTVTDEQGAAVLRFDVKREHSLH